MKHLALVAALSLCLLTGARAAGPHSIPLEPAPTPVAQPGDSAANLAPRLSVEAAQAMAAEMQALHQAQLSAEEAAVATFASISVEERDLIARRLREANEQLMVELLRVQLRYAQDAGLSEQVAALDAKITRYLELQALPTHLPAELATKSDRVDPTPTLPSVQPITPSKDNGFGDGGEDQ